ncbi:DedA family protein [Streptomyces sp. PSAA01]|uniref:DedA family protein n=1 Tax=Streptomyces sp. PSAA01 TaxID=2912762 RepID=UPI001F458920|nr:DedA family protein [Streptomyces sp. PSAA01]MCG0290777.1 DedA family protein [Streptomyces sp. PSAA01]
MPLALNPLDAAQLLTAFGTTGVFLVLFAETGLLIGFFLPGDSLLFTAGLLCTASGGGIHLSLPGVLLAAAAGALLGAQAGYLIGRRAGRVLPAGTRGRHLSDGVRRAEELLARYGHGKAIVLARFIPVVRTVLNPLAGMAGVPARTFALWQVAGGVMWTGGLVLGGYALGASVPNVDHYLLPLVAVLVHYLLPLVAGLVHYLLPLVAVLVAVSVLPLALEALSVRRGRTAAEQAPGCAK